jgi:hypothetical protein
MKQAGEQSMQLLAHGATPKNLSTKLTENDQQPGGISGKKLKWVNSMLKQARALDALYDGLEMEKMIKTDLVGPDSIKAREGANRLMCSASVSRLFFGRSLPLTVALINPCVDDTAAVEVIPCPKKWWSTHICESTIFAAIDSLFKCYVNTNGKSFINHMDDDGQGQVEDLHTGEIIHATAFMPESQHEEPLSTFEAVRGSTRLSQEAHNQLAVQETETGLHRALSDCISQETKRDLARWHIGSV